MNHMKSRIPRIGTLVKALASIGILCAVLYFIDFGEAKDILLTAHPWYMLALIAIFFIDRALMAFKWDPLLRVLDIKVPLIRLTAIYFIAPLTGLVMPSTVGGDIFRIYALSRFKVNKSSALASIVVEKFLALAAMLVPAGLSFALAIYFFRSELAEISAFLWTIAIGGLIAAVAAFILWTANRRGVGRLAKLANKLPLIRRLDGTFTAFRQYRKHPKVLAYVLALSVIEQMVPMAVTYLIFMTLGIDVLLLQLFIMVPIIALAIRLPISFGGLGVQEALYVGLFALAGVSPAEAVLASLSVRVLENLTALPWAIHYLIVRPKDEAKREGAILEPVGNA